MTAPPVSADSVLTACFDDFDHRSGTIMRDKISFYPDYPIASPSELEIPSTVGAFAPRVTETIHFNYDANGWR